MTGAAGSRLATGARASVGATRTVPAPSRGAASKLLHPVRALSPRTAPHQIELLRALRDGTVLGSAVQDCAVQDCAAAAGDGITLMGDTCGRSPVAALDVSATGELRKTLRG